MDNNEMFPDVTNQFDADDIMTNKSMAIVATIPILFWVPLVTNSKDSPFAKFYCNQGLLLLIACVALNIVKAILGLIHIPVLSTLIGLVLWAAPIAAWIYEIVSAANSKAKPIPFIGNLFTLIQ